MVHLRVIAPSETADRAMQILEEAVGVSNVVRLEGVARRPEGDLILCDVAREDASVIVSDLKELGIEKSGAITLEPMETQLSEGARRAERETPGAPADAVVGGGRGAHLRRGAPLLQLRHLHRPGRAHRRRRDLPRLADPHRRRDGGGTGVRADRRHVRRACRAQGAARARVDRRAGRRPAAGDRRGAARHARLQGDRRDARHVQRGRPRPGGDDRQPPDVLSFFVAFCAGAAGMLSLSTAKSGALVGVLISVTTIPAAANVGVSTAYAEWGSAGGSLAQLALNVVGIHLAGTLTLYLQRVLYRRRRVEHLYDEARADAGLPVGRSSRA